jgi:hypothetical protein
MWEKEKAIMKTTRKYDLHGSGPNGMKWLRI